MKKLVIIISALSVLFLSACEQTVSYDGVESAGKRLGNEDNELFGNSYVLGSDSSVNIVMDAVAAYNSLDAEKEMSYYSDDYVTEERMAGMKEWHDARKCTAQNEATNNGQNIDTHTSYLNETREWSTKTFPN